jgi:hypothetical protein
MNRIARASLHITNNTTSGWASFVRKYGEELRTQAFLFHKTKKSLVSYVAESLNISIISLEKLEPTLTLLNKIGNGGSLEKRIESGLQILQNKIKYPTLENKSELNFNDKNFLEETSLLNFLSK